MKFSKRLKVGLYRFLIYEVIFSQFFEVMYIMMNAIGTNMLTFILCQRFGLGIRRKRLRNIAVRDEHACSNIQPWRYL